MSYLTLVVIGIVRNVELDDYVVSLGVTRTSPELARIRVSAEHIAIYHIGFGVWCEVAP